MITNGEKILNTKQAPGNIAAINGIRTISTTWVILGHTVALTATYAGKIALMLSWMFFFNTTFSVQLDYKIEIRI